MYLVPIEVSNSNIEGEGVFALEAIEEGAITWKFDPTQDRVMSQAEFSTLSEEEQTELLRVAYLSPMSKRWVYPKNNDPSLYTNHSPNNNQSVVFDVSVSEEPFFRANRYIQKGEELTVNYAEFDERPDEMLEDWAKS